jgi:hypothetical protein
LHLYCARGSWGALWVNVLVHIQGVGPATGVCGVIAQEKSFAHGCRATRGAERWTSAPGIKGQLARDVVDAASCIRPLQDAGFVSATRMRASWMGGVGDA